MINVVIPMAGEGSRFKNAGYKTPKPFIEVLNKPMICQVLDNLKLEGAKYILILRKEHFEKEKETIYQIEKKYNVELILIDKLTEGALCTILFAHRLINNSNPLLIANSDQIVDINIQDFIDNSNKNNSDGSILCFEDNNKKWSYVKVNEDNLITQVKEKEVISNYATVGIYYFNKGYDFVSCALDELISNDTVNGEFYCAPVYNYLIKNNKKITPYLIKKEQMHGIGTPEDLDIYLNLKKEAILI